MCLVFAPGWASEWALQQAPSANILFICLSLQWVHRSLFTCLLVSGLTFVSTSGLEKETRYVTEASYNHWFL